MEPKIPELAKRAGVFYAVTDDDLELPVIDVTNPAFELRLSDSDVETLLQQFLQEVRSQEKTPAFIMKLMLRVMQRHSVLMRGLQGASGTYLGGMHTYMMKLGPENLNRRYFSGIDRRIAAAPNVLFLRLRLQDMAHLLADALLSPLRTRPGATLQLLNIGGGAAIDSLNALLVLRREQPDLLGGRQIHVKSYDRETGGADFGGRALASLMAMGAPLAGLHINFDHCPYDWSEPARLCDLGESFKDGRTIVAISSEGALFEYGSDEEIIGNLEAVHAVTPSDAVVVGSVTRSDALGLAVNRVGQRDRAALQFRGLEAFTALARRSGWQVVKSIDRPLAHDVLMDKA